MIQFQLLGEQMKLMEQLQELDLKIDHLRRGKEALPKLLKPLDDALAQARETLRVKKTAVEELEKGGRQTQAAIDLNRDRMSRSNARMEAVKNSQEYQAIQREIEQLKKLNTSLEEQSKKSSQEIEALQGEVQKLTAECEKVQKERDERAALATGEGAQFDSELAILNQSRTQLASQVESRVLSHYDRLRAARGGLGIAPAVAGRCKACNMVVPPQLYNELLRATSMRSCPSCSRLLYVPAENRAAAQVSS